MEYNLKLFVSVIVLTLIVITSFYHLLSSNNGIDIHVLKLNQTNQILLEPVHRKYSLYPPSKHPYNLTQGRNITAYKNIYNTWVLSFFNNKTNGVFLEAGVNDGETMSHTLFLEVAYNWTGLIVECNPNLVETVKSRHRKAWFASACLGPSNSSEKLNFSFPKRDLGKYRTLYGSLGSAVDYKPDFEVETVPLFSLLAAVQMFKFDYFSFDIEWAELSVLEGFPFHLASFKVLIIEQDKNRQHVIRKLDQLLFKNGYSFMNSKFPSDRLYVHKSALK